MKHERDERGFALVIVMLLMAVLVSLLAGYFILTHIDLTTTRSSLDGTRGFYAAEAGLNLRAETIRGAFLGFDTPDGASPLDDEDNTPCEPGNAGDGDFECVEYPFSTRTAMTYAEEDPTNPSFIVVPRGELFQNLAAEEHGFVVHSRGQNRERVEAVVEMHFNSRLVPVFQFAAFYDKDLEILPNPGWTLSGPVHTNGDLYLGGDNRLDLLAQVTTAGDLYRGRKGDDACTDGNPRVDDLSNLVELPPCSGDARTQMDPADLAAWDGMIRTGIAAVTPPATTMLDPTPGEVYWDRADLRIALDIHAAPAIEVRNANGTVHAGLTGALNGCGVTSRSTTFYDHREGARIEMLDVDVRGLIDCVHANDLLGVGRGLDDDTDGGIVLYLTVDGPDSAGQNTYGVRVRNGTELAATDINAPVIQGLTIVTDQAMYVRGDYNAVLDKKPAAFLADSMNVLSTNWDDDNSGQPVGGRIAGRTTINAAFLAGTDTTGGIEGWGGQDLGQYNGGLENFIRLHEKWTGQTLSYRGSLVSLSNPRHVDGAFAASSFTRPILDWDYDTDLDDTINLPPLTPRFVYLEQEMFVREFEL